MSGTGIIERELEEIVKELKLANQIELYKLGLISETRLKMRVGLVD